MGQRILNMEIMERNMATMRDVAKKANVGLGTVSRAISGDGYVAEEKKELIFKAAEELGYQISNYPKKKKITEKIIGILVPDVSLPFYGKIVKFLDIELANHGYKTMLYNTLGVQGRVSEVIDLVENGVLQGIIINADASQEEIKRLEKLPVIGFEKLLGKRISMVSSEHKEGGRIVGQLLEKNGCKNVLIITAKHLVGVYGDYRIDECREYLESKGIHVTVAEYPASNISISSVSEIAKQYMDLYHNADGIFSDDIVAYSCLQHAKQGGKNIPEDLKIVGYDGNELLQLSIPRLTTIKQDIPLLARTCVELLQRKLDGERLEEEYFIPVILEKGGTTS